MGKVRAQSVSVQSSGQSVTTLDAARVTHATHKVRLSKDASTEVFLHNLLLQQKVKNVRNARHDNNSSRYAIFICLLALSVLPERIAFHIYC